MVSDIRVKPEYHELRDYWESFLGAKPRRTIFKERVVICGLDKSRAILLKPRRIYQRKTLADKEGRVCTFCGEYKPRSEYQRSGRSWRRSNCKNCSSEKRKQKYHKEENRIIQAKKREKTRLKLGDRISFWKIKIIDEVPREEVRICTKEASRWVSCIIKNELTWYFSTVKTRGKKTWYRVL